MTLATIATIFSGGEGVGVGARMAGLNHLWGVEYDDKIAQVARDNGFNTITARVKMLTQSEFKAIYYNPQFTRTQILLVIKPERT